MSQYREWTGKGEVGAQTGTLGARECIEEGFGSCEGSKCEGKEAAEATTLGTWRLRIGGGVPFAAAGFVVLASDVFRIEDLFDGE